jgi:hypothetical protein
MYDGDSKDWYKKQHENFTKPFYNHSTYWALTLGNHDTEGDLNSAEISELDRSYNLSLS